MKSVEERFWEKVDKSGECWEWKAAKLPQGYGLFGHKGKMARAHRFSYELSFGKIEGRLLVCHKCDNPSCVRPDHLFLGTHKDNFEDMINKNRGYIEVKLTDEVVKKMSVIYNYHLGIKMRNLANEFGVTPETVSSIFTNKTWKSVKWDNRRLGDPIHAWLKRYNFDPLTEEEVNYWKQVFRDTRNNDKRTLEYRNGIA